MKMKLLTLSVHIDFICNDMQTKSKAGILDIKKQSFAWLMTIVGYNDYLKRTLTKEDFMGDWAVFEELKKKQNSNNLIECTLYNDRFNISFYKPYTLENKTIAKIEAYCIKPNGWKVYNLRFIETFADLAEMTKDNPLKLR